MNSMSKEQLEGIANGIFASGDVVAGHGTTIANAKSILETGFNFNRTSMVIFRSKDPVSLCTYGWKEAGKGDSASVVICIPKSFIMQMASFNEDEYNEFMTKIKNGKEEEMLINSVSDVKIDPSFRTMFSVHVPRCFVKGMFIYTDGTNYLDFINNKEEAMNHLTYIENKYYFENLSVEEQQEMIASIVEAHTRPTQR